MSPFNLKVITVAASFTMLTGPLLAQHRCLEISPDGFEIVDSCGVSHAAGVDSRGAGVPYGTVPNWQNTLRRQVACVQVADIDHDGRNDLIAGCYQSQSFPAYTNWQNFIYRNIGNSLEAEPSWISADQVHTGDVAIADFNGDGFVDVFFANGGSAFTPSRIYFGNNDGSGPSTVHGWQSSVSPGIWVTSAIAFDFDHDGDIDVLTTNQGVSPNPFRPMYLFRNHGTGLETTPSWQSAESSIQNGLDVADFNGDGWEDVAVAKWVNGFQSGIYLNQEGTLQTTPAWRTNESVTDKGAGFADVNNDGQLEVAFGGNATTTNPTRTFVPGEGGILTRDWQSNATNQGAQEIRWMDVNYDGWPDLTAIHFSTGRCDIHINNRGILDEFPTWSYDPPMSGTAVNYGDINGDGCVDLVIGYSGEPSLVVFYHAGNCQPQCPGDIAPEGGDGSVGVPDLLNIISNWGACPAPPAACSPDVAPPGGDGNVGVPDLLFIISNWGSC